MREERETPSWRTRSVRTQGGFSLLIVIGISAVILLLVSTLFMRAGADRRDRSAQRSTTNSLYAAEAGLNMLAGKLGAMGFGTSTTLNLGDPNLSYLVTDASENDEPIDQRKVVADVAAGRLALTTTAYADAVPEKVGDDLGFLVYSVKASTCQVTTKPCPTANVQQVDLAAGANTIDSSKVLWLDVEVVGFQGRSGVASLKARLTPKVQSFLALLPYVAVGQELVSTAVTPAMGAKPFCAITGDSVDCSDVRYLQQIYLNPSAGGVIYQDSASANSCLNNSNCQKVIGIYKDPETSTPVYLVEKETPPTAYVTAAGIPVTDPSKLQPWPVVKPDTGEPLGLPKDAAGKTFAPYLPESAVVKDSNNKYALKTGYGYLPSGLPNGTLQGTAIPGSLASVTMTIPSVDGLPETTITDSADFSLVPVIQTDLVASGATGANKYGLVQLSNGSGGGVTLKDGHTLTLKPGRYVLSGLSTSDGAALIVSPQNPGSSGRSDPVVIYLTGDNSSMDLGKISPPTTDPPDGTTVNPWGAAANLQIYSSTSGTINLRGDDTGSLRALVYAPNAQIVINGKNKSDEEGRGSIVGTFVGKTVTFIGTGTGTTSTTLIYDQSLGDEDSAVRTTRSAIVGNWKRQ